MDYEGQLMWQVLSRSRLSVFKQNLWMSDSFRPVDRRCHASWPLPSRPWVPLCMKPGPSRWGLTFPRPSSSSAPACWPSTGPAPAWCWQRSWGWTRSSSADISSSSSTPMGMTIWLGPWVGNAFCCWGVAFRLCVCVCVCVCVCCWGKGRGSFSFRSSFLFFSF